MLCSLLVGIHFGIGRHEQDLSLEDLREATKWIYIPRTEFVIACMFTRLSIAAFMLHIFAIERKWRRSLYVIMTFIILTSLLSVSVVLLAQCQPIRKIWDPTVPGKCWEPDKLNTIGLIFNSGKLSPNFIKLQILTADVVIAIASDLTLASMPIFFLWKIQMTFRAKVWVCFIMGLGSLWVILIHCQSVAENRSHSEYIAEALRAP